MKFWAFVVGAAPLDPELEAFWGELGFVVVQGYGLTETAPIVTLNHPFGTQRGSVGKPIAGVEVKIADDGEILVRGENVTTRLLQRRRRRRARAFEDGWFHTGDIGELDDEGQLLIRGRKKEMIVTPEGLNVFPEDVERVLNEMPGVRDSAVVGASAPGRRRARARGARRSSPGVDPDAVVREANAQLARSSEDPRARRLAGRGAAADRGHAQAEARGELTQWLRRAAAAPPAAPAGRRRHRGARRAGSRRAATIAPATTIDELGLSSLERVELMVALEDAFQTRIDEGAFVGDGARTSASSARSLDARGGGRRQRRAGAGRLPVVEPVAGRRARCRRVSLPTWILPLARVVRVDARRGAAST